MTLPLLGPLPVSGFANAWFFLYLVIVAGLVALYIVILRAGRKRVLRFANVDLLEMVAPQRGPSRWRHLPVALLIASPAVLTTAMAADHPDLRWACFPRYEPGRTRQRVRRLAAADRLPDRGRGREHGMGAGGCGPAGRGGFRGAPDPSPAAELSRPARRRT